MNLISPLKMNQEPHKKWRSRWRKIEEKLLLDIVNKYDGGALKKVIVNNTTNVKMNRHDAWE